jgi:hypothetical protein
MVDDDLGLFALLPDSRQADIHTGIRVPYLSSSVKGLRGFVRLSVLSPRMFLALPYPYCRQKPAYHHFEPYHRRVRRRERRHAGQEELVLSR